MRSVLGRDGFDGKGGVLFSGFWVGCWVWRGSLGGWCAWVRGLWTVHRCTGVRWCGGVWWCFWGRSGKGVPWFGWGVCSDVLVKIFDGRIWDFSFGICGKAFERVGCTFHFSYVVKSNRVSKWIKDFARMECCYEKKSGAQSLINMYTLMPSTAIKRVVKNDQTSP